MLKNEAIKTELQAAMKERFNEKRQQQMKDKQRVDWFDEYSSACVPAVRRYLLKQEMMGTQVEIEFYDEHLMHATMGMSKQLLDFILEWRKVLMDRMEMLNEQYKRWE